MEPGKSKKVGGVIMDEKKSVRLVKAEEAEEAAFVLCLPWDPDPHYFTDDVKGTCSICGIDIRHRPHVPKKPKKVCLMCTKLLLKDAIDSEALITNETLADVIPHLIHPEGTENKKGKE